MIKIIYKIIMKIIKFSFLLLRKAVSHSKRIRKGFRASMQGGKGEFCIFFNSKLGCCLLISFRGGGKGSDEEHITYSGGQEIFDLLQCG